jgi:hypothetical protein
MKGGKLETKIFCVCLSVVKYPFEGVETIKLDVWIVETVELRW